MIRIFALLAVNGGMIAVFVLLLVLAAFVLDRLGLWMESRGWIYWRKVKPKGGGMSRTLTALQEFVQPEIQHVIEDREQRTAASDDLAGKVGDQKVRVDFPPAARPSDANGASEGAGQSPGPLVH